MTEPDGQLGERLQKVLAQAGLGSRRACEALIEQGRVVVNGRTVEVHGRRVDPARDEIRVDGRLVITRSDVVVIALNKPRGVVSTLADERGRPCLSDVLPGVDRRVFHVGRLDQDTEGLLLLTNDGDLANHIAHPRHEVSKTYLAMVRGRVNQATMRSLTTGIDLEDGPVRCDRAVAKQQQGDRTLVEVVLHEGRNRIVRRMMEAVGHPVESLVRTRIGPIALGTLRPGEHRELLGKELADLYAAAGM